MHGIYEMLFTKPADLEIGFRGGHSRETTVVRGSTFLSIKKEDYILLDG